MGVMSENDTSLPRLDADGRERPHFVFSYPRDPRLDALVAAFERGDFRAVRDGVPMLLRESADPAVKEAAEDLRSRTRPDPLVRWFWFASVSVFTFLVIWSYFHSP